MVTPMSCRKHAVMQSCAYVLVFFESHGRFARNSDELYEFSRGSKVDGLPRVASVTALGQNYL